MEYTKVQPQKTEADSAGTVKISKQLLDKLKVTQKRIFSLYDQSKLQSCFVALLGADETGTVQEMFIMLDGKINVGGCIFIPEIRIECITDATTELIKKGLTPCGFLRCFPYSHLFEHIFCSTISTIYNCYSITHQKDAVQHRLDALCGVGKLKAFTIWLGGLVIEQYADDACTTANTYSYETVGG